MHEVALTRFCPMAVVEVVTAEILVVAPVGQQVPDDDHESVGQGEDRLVLVLLTESA